jgi:hypothetical protein
MSNPEERLAAKLFVLLGCPPHLNDPEIIDHWEKVAKTLLARYPLEELYSIFEWSVKDDWYTKMYTDMDGAFNAITKTKNVAQYRRAKQAEQNVQNAKAKKVGTLFEHIENLRKLQAEGKL